MLTLRPMADADVAGAVAAFESGFLAMRARFGLPITGGSLQDEQRRQERTRHFLATDPGGSWVADDDGTIVGLSQSFVREDYWMLSQLGTVPGVQGRGLGRELLRLALSHGDPTSPGTIQCSRDPKAMALYSSFGFSLHPVVAAWGHLRPGAVTRPEEVQRVEPEDVSETHLLVVTAIDRHVRGSARTIDIVSMLSQPGQSPAAARRPWLRRGQGRAHRHAGGGDDESASLVLRTMLAESPEGETIEVNWLTSAQQWAIEVLTRAGVELQPYGPVMVRGMDGPPSPYIPSGGYG